LVKWSKVILVLATKEDYAAAAFAQFAAESKVPCRVVSDFTDVRASLVVTRDRSCKARLTTVPDSKMVTAVLNRGTLLMAAGPDEQFSRGEGLASWWSLLGLFPGPVINRPSLDGFLPVVEPALLAKRVPGVLPPKVRISSAIERFAVGEEVNVHNIHGAYLSRLQDVKYSTLGPEIHVYTPFVPCTVWRLLVVGDSLFDLSSPDGSVNPSRKHYAEGIADELRKRGATFSLAVIGERLEGTELLHATPFPLHHHYAHLEPTVHAALLGSMQS